MGELPPSGSPEDDAPPPVPEQDIALDDAATRTVVIHPAVRWWTWPIVVTLLFLLLQPIVNSGWALFTDSYRYAKQVELNLGETPERAHEIALDTYCENKTWYRTWDGFASRTWTGWVPIDDTPQRHQTRVEQCHATYGPRGGDVTTTDPRYQSIFTSRPGYPLLATPFVAALGIVDGMRVLGLVLACAGGIAVYGLLRAARLRATAAALGQGIYLASPMGWWALQALGEGLVNLTILGALGGILLLRQGRVRAGYAVTAISWAALAVTRFSSLLLVAAALAAACAVLALWVDRRRPEPRRRMWTATAVHAAASLLTFLAMPVLGLPGASVTLQDTFTRHFADPLVPNPWYRLAAANYHFWPQWLTNPSASALLLVTAVLGTVALLRWRRDLMWLSLALFGAGFVHVAAHPLAQEAQRLGLLMWIPGVVGLAVALDALTRRLGAQVTLTLRASTPRNGARDTAAAS